MNREKNQSSETMCSKFEINFLRLLPWGTVPLSSPVENFLGKILLDLTESKYLSGPCGHLSLQPLVHRENSQLLSSTLPACSNVTVQGTAPTCSSHQTANGWARSYICTQLFLCLHVPQSLECASFIPLSARKISSLSFLAPA